MILDIEMVWVAAITCVIGLPIAVLSAHLDPRGHQDYRVPWPPLQPTRDWGKIFGRKTMLIHVSFHWRLARGEAEEARHASGFGDMLIDSDTGPPRTKEDIDDMCQIIRKGMADGTDIVIIAWNEMRDHTEGGRIPS